MKIKKLTFQRGSITQGVLVWGFMSYGFRKYKNQPEKNYYQLSYRFHNLLKQFYVNFKTKPRYRNLPVLTALLFIPFLIAFTLWYLGCLVYVLARILFYLLGGWVILAWKDSWVTFCAALFWEIVSITLFILLLWR